MTPRDRFVERTPGQLRRRTTEGVFVMQLDAGEFGAWLEEIRTALRDDLETRVACGTCTGCCTSSQFITVAPSDVGARARIPPQLLFDAPGRPPGHRLMGYDARGHCPMLSDGLCSIYAQRPHGCRTYDCRVFVAAGVDPGPERAAIQRRVRSWRFSYETADARRAHDAVRRAAHFLCEHAGAFPGGRAPSRPADVAVTALKVYELFVDEAMPEDVAAARELARRVVERAQAFDRRV